jgi:hypothetical protein
VQREAAAYAGLAHEVEESLRWWTDRYPFFDRSRVPALALTTAVHLADLTAAERDVAAAIKLWICAFDDAVDEQQITRIQMDELANESIRLFDATPPNTPVVHPMSVALRDIVSRLQRYRTYVSLRSLIQARVNTYAQGVILQWDWGAARSEQGHVGVPTYAEHMAVARDSTSVPFYLAVCYVLYDDAALMERLPYLVEVGNACATVLRLSNDLRTWDKEDREGTFNTLAALEGELHQADPHLAASDRRSRAQQLIAERLETAVVEVQRLLDQSPVPHGAAEDGIARFTRFVTGFYIHHDFREYTTA